MLKLNFLGCISLLVLAGCGGGSSSSEDRNDPDPDLDIQEPAPENTAPSASAGTSSNVKGGTVVSLDGSASSDEDGDALTFAWSIDSSATAHFITEDGSLTDTLESATGRLLVPASQAGKDIIVSLEVSDGSATAIDTVTYSVEACTERSGYVFTECVDPSWQGPMAWDVNFQDVTEYFGYYDNNSENHVRWNLLDVDGDNRGSVFDVTFNKENWNGSFRFVPAGFALDSSASVDLSRYEDGNLVFDLRVVEPTDAEIYISAECIYPCEATPRQVLSATDGSWSTISIPLSEFSGMDWSQTSIPFSIYPEWGNQTDVRLQVDNIRFESPSCVEEENVIFDECLGPNWYTMAAVDDNTPDEPGVIHEYVSGTTENHVQWNTEFSGSPQYGDVLAVQFTSDARNGHFYVRTELRELANDISAYLNGALVFEMKVQDYGSNTDGLIVRVDTWWDGKTSDEIPLPELAVDEWTTIEIPVSDLLVGGGLDPTEVNAGFSIWPIGDQEGVNILLDNIRWETQLSE